MPTPDEAVYAYWHLQEIADMEAVKIEQWLLANKAPSWIIAGLRERVYREPKNGQ